MPDTSVLCCAYSDGVDKTSMAQQAALISERFTGTPC
jgi:hypothetical protein